MGTLSGKRLISAFSADKRRSLVKKCLGGIHNFPAEALSFCVLNQSPLFMGIERI